LAKRDFNPSPGFNIKQSEAHEVIYPIQPTTEDPSSKLLEFELEFTKPESNLGSMTNP